MSGCRRNYTEVCWADSGAVAGVATVGAMEARVETVGVASCGPGCDAQTFRGTRGHCRSLSFVRMLLGRECQRAVQERKRENRMYLLSCQSAHKNGKCGQ